MPDRIADASTNQISPLLALDGGGVRGLFSAMVLADLERRMGRPLCDVFKLVTGTSTGGILALLIASGRYSMAEIVDLYQALCVRVFPPSHWRMKRYIAQSILKELKLVRSARPLYRAEPLEDLLKEHLAEGGRALGMHEAKTRVAVTAWDAEGEMAQLFTSYNGGSAVRMWEAARSTSAAQTYFAPFELKLNYDTMALTDGGGGENNPSRIAIAESVSLALANPLLISVGTGLSRRVENRGELRRMGLLDWGRRMLRFTMQASAYWADHTARRVLPVGRYYRFQADIPAGVNVAMDDASGRNMEALTTWAAGYIREESRRLDDVAALLVNR